MEKIEELRTRKYILTCWLKDIKQQDIYDFCFSSDIEDRMVKLTIGAIEKTENELEHFHVYMQFKEPIRATTLIKRLNAPSTHFEKMRGTLKQAYEYVTKEGTFFNNIAESELSENVSDEDNAYALLVRDIFDNNYSMYEICRKYSKIAILHISNIEKLFQIRDKEQIREFQEKIFEEAFNFVE